MLTIRELSFSYGAVQTLSGVSMQMTRGQVTCVMGRNGVGKTTLMRNIMGTLRATVGEVIVGDRNITRLQPNRRARAGLALVPQGRQIFPKLTVEENLRVGLQARSDGRRDIPEDVLELFPILKTMSRRMGGDLSGGQQQQLAIARALVGDPKVLLLDEPTEGIQPNIIQQIGEVLRQLVSVRQMTIVLVEQYLDFVREFGNRFYIMNRGRVVADGIAADLDASMVNQHLSV
ncbi:MAG: urea ABC transporter ATP-binding subunit UrtE [Tepidisphaeraceae bacterium]|jgi:urea transport system ATP-binding protein